MNCDGFGSSILYNNIDTQKQVAVQMCGFDWIRRRAEVEVRVGKLKNGKATVGDEITGEMIKGEGDRVADWIWRLCWVLCDKNKKIFIYLLWLTRTNAVKGDSPCYTGQRWN